jgi:phosphocarrier protein
MIRQQVTIKNTAGLHARPSATLVKVASQFQSEFSIYLNGYRVNGKSILGVMTLAAEFGAVLDFEFEGVDEEEAMKTVVDLVEKKFEVHEDQEI